jgi:hypothetical protein
MSNTTITDVLAWDTLVDDPIKMLWLLYGVCAYIRTVSFLVKNPLGNWRHPDYPITIVTLLVIFQFTNNPYIRGVTYLVLMCDAIWSAYRVVGYISLLIHWMFIATPKTQHAPTPITDTQTNPDEESYFCIIVDGFLLGVTIPGKSNKVYAAPGKVPMNLDYSFSIQISDRNNHPLHVVFACPPGNGSLKAFRNAHPELDYMVTTTMPNTLSSCVLDAQIVVSALHSFLIPLMNKRNLLDAEYHSRRIPIPVPMGTPPSTPIILASTTPPPNSPSTLSHTSHNLPTASTPLPTITPGFLSISNAEYPGSSDSSDSNSDYPDSSDDEYQPGNNA